MASDRTTVMKKAIYVILALVAVGSAYAGEKDTDRRVEFDTFARRATARLPARWRVAEHIFGPQDITMFWGPRPVGLRVRLDGPQLWYPHIYTGRPMPPNEEREYFRDRPESISIWIVPHSYSPQKDSFLVDCFRPKDQKTYRLGSIGTLDLYAYGGYCYSWVHWRSDIKRNLRE